MALIEDLKRVQSDTFAMANQAKFYHWNVEGSDFPQYHDFFGELYEELTDAVDKLAEHVRQLDAYAPGGHSMYMKYTRVADDDRIPAGKEMFRNLIGVNDTVLEGLIICYMAAEEAKELGLTNYLQDRIEQHTKHRWMLKATAK